MRQLIVGIMLAICLVGCGEKAKFAISDTDKIRDLANNPVFQEVYPDSDRYRVFKFEATPQSILGIKTDNVNISGGYMRYTVGYPLCAVMLELKGKDNFDKLLANIKTAFPDAKKLIDRGNVKATEYYLIVKINGKDQSISISYSPILDVVFFSTMDFNNCVA